MTSNLLRWTSIHSTNIFVTTTACELIYNNDKLSVKWWFGLSCKQHCKLKLMSNPRSAKEMQWLMGNKGVSKKKGQERKYKNDTDGEKMPYHSKFLTKDDTSIETSDPLTLHYQRDLNLRLWNSYFFTRSSTDRQRSLLQLLLGLTSKARRGRRLSNMRSACPSHRSLWLYNCSVTDMFLGPNTLHLTYILLIPCAQQIVQILQRQRQFNTDSFPIS